MHFACMCSCMESLRQPLLEAQLDREAHTSQNSPLWNFATEIMVSYTSSFPDKKKKKKLLSTFSFMLLIIDYSISYPGASAQASALLSLERESRRESWAR